VRRPRRVANGEERRVLLRTGFVRVTRAGFGSGSTASGKLGADVLGARHKPIHAANFKSNAGIGSPDSCNPQPGPPGALHNVGYWLVEH
jgi:hypothetical protein